MREHDHVFDFYRPTVDRWECRCGVSMDGERALWNVDGTRVQRTVIATTADRVESGRELLSC